MRISCPDFGRLAKKYVETPQFFFNSPIFQGNVYAAHQTALQRLCTLMYGFGHRWMWDFESLNAVLGNTGFVDIAEREFGASPQQPLCGRDRERRREQSIYVEATRPR
jgi:hypothetical protein